jgi:peptidyl-prolyl cis-trans isomerase C
MLTVFSIALTACAPEQQASDMAQNDEAESAVVLVDGRAITPAMLQNYARSRAQKDAGQLTPDEREALLDELIQIRLLTNEAEATGLVNDEALAAELELQRMQTVARQMISAHLDNNPVSDTELREAYEQNQEQLAGTQYKARHILVEEEAEAVEIIEALAQGADFEELARTSSTGPSGPNGGDLGWFTADRMVPPFASAVQSMEVGTFSQQPVQTRFGWHVILLEEKSDQQTPDLEAVRDDVTAIVTQSKVEAFLESLENNSSISRPN